ncbi:MAG TPA: ABC transporter permease [Cyclobacteriaceae bacterium]
MISNYIKIALRYLFRNISSSSLNIIGMSIGIACVLVIVAHVQFELSYDTFHSNHKNIYRLSEKRIDEGRELNSAVSFSPLAELMRSHIPSITRVVRMYPITGIISPDKINKEKETLFTFADSLLFDVFDFIAVHGDLNTALNHPFSVVLSESRAIKMYGKSDVVGRSLYFEDEEDLYEFTITAIIKDIPQNSHFNTNILASFASISKIQPWYNNWHYPPMFIYVEVKDGTNPNDLQTQIKSMGENHFPDYIKTEKREYIPQNTSDIHLFSDLESEWQANSNYEYIKFFMIIAGFILVIACINFTNLSTVQSIKRSHEVGLRKVLGASKLQLVGQHLGESLIITLISVVISFGLAELILVNFYNQLIGKTISIGFLLEGVNLVAVIASIVLVILLSGSYPAFYLSKFSPVSALTNKGNLKSGLGSFSKFLVVFQFIVASILIIATITIQRQISFMRTTNLGFNEEQLIAIRLVDRESQVKYQVLTDELLKESMVENVALSSTIPGVVSYFVEWQILSEEMPEGTEFSMASLGVDEEFIPTYNIEILEGRNFSKDIPTDLKAGYILNEAAADKLGWENPVGKDFQMTVYINGEEVRKGKVIGLVKDFHHESLYNSIDPLVLYINKHPYFSDYLTIRLNHTNWQDAIAMLESKWKSFNPDKPMELVFVDDEIEKNYNSEVLMGKIFGAFSVLSIIISCLGLFGLSSYTAQLKTKEIGIRKVLGADITSILKMLYREYLGLVLIANLISWPVSYYILNKWLTTFPYHVNIGVLVFILALIIAALITIAAISLQSMRSATANPVKSLRTE